MKEFMSNGFADSIAQAIEEMKAEQRDSFSLEKINLAELDRLRQAGFEGGATIVKEYISVHKHLMPAKRQQSSPQGNRGRHPHYVSACSMLSIPSSF